jgi:hypothetical protein
VDNVFKFLSSILDEIGGVGNGVGEFGVYLRREVKVLDGKLVHYRINLNNGGVDTMSVEGCWCSADSKTAVRLSVTMHKGLVKERIKHT